MIIQIVLYTTIRRMENSQPKTHNNNKDEDEKTGNVETKTESLDPVTEPNGKELLLRKLVLVFLGCCFGGFNQAMEQCSVLFIATFATNSPIKLSDQEGTRILLGLNVGFAVGRAAGIVTVLKVLPQFILAVNFGLALLGNTLLLTVGGSSLTWMWIGSICLGLGFSTMYPAFYAFLEKHLFVSDTIAATITVSAGLVSALYPLIVKKYVEEMPKILNYMDYVGCAVCIAALLSMFYLTRRKANR